MFHIIDDEPELLDILLELIERAGFKAMQFNSAEAYLEYFDSLAFITPTGIISDYQMGELTGVELIEKIRAKIPLLKAVIISGMSDPEQSILTNKCLCHFLPKPYQFDKIFTLLNTLDKCERDPSPLSHKYSINCKYGLDHECPFQPNNSDTE